MAPKRTFLLASFIATSFTVALNAAAQTPPAYDAGALMRQNEQSIRAYQQQQSMKKSVLLPPAATLPDGSWVTPARFIFIGNQRLSTEQLQTVTVPYANRPLNQRDLQHLTDAVTQEYRKSGWLVQAYIPHQNLAGSVLTIQVIESIAPGKP